LLIQKISIDQQLPAVQVRPALRGALRRRTEPFWGVAGGKKNLLVVLQWVGWLFQVGCFPILRNPSLKKKEPKYCITWKFGCSQHEPFKQVLDEQNRNGSFSSLKNAEKSKKHMELYTSII